MWKKTTHLFDGMVNLLSLLMLLYIAVVVHKSQANTTVTLRRAPSLTTGRPVPVKDLNWRGKKHTLVFALQSTCHFCSASAPFYSELLKRQQAGDWQAVAVLPQSTEKAFAYMRSEGYVIPEVRQMSLGAIGVSGTPTLLLVDQNGKLERAWIGKLTASQEDEVADALGVGKLAHYQEASLIPTAGTANGGSSRVERPDDADPTGAKSVHLVRPFPDEPVRIVGLFDDVRDIAPFLHDPQIASKSGHPYRLWDNVPFQAGDNWIDGLVIVVKNLSNKEITSGSVHIRFPQTGSGAPGDAFVSKTISLGWIPEQALYARDGHSVEPPPVAPINIAPGQEMRFVLSPYSVELRKLIETKRPFSSVSRCAIMLSYFYFSDDTRWASFAGFQKADPSVPGKYVRISAQEFGGETAVLN